MIYCATLWWASEEQELLDIKFDEGRSVDQWIIGQATTTFRGNPREIHYPKIPPDINVDLIVSDTSNIKGTTLKSNRERNAIQRNSTLDLVKGQLRSGDVFVFCDLDEIIHQDDWKTIKYIAQLEGFVFLLMRYYYGKIDLQAPGRWNAVFAVSAEFIKDNPEATVDKLRQKRMVNNSHRKITIQGQHFSWLYPDLQTQFISAKRKNNSRTPVKCCKNLMRGRGPGGRELNLVEVDSTYPGMIRSNLSYWSKYMVKQS